MSTQEPPRLFPSMRMLICAFVFFGLCVLYMQRINMSLAVICMVNNTWLMNHSSTTNDEQALRKTPNLDLKITINYYASFTTKDGPFTYDKKTQGLILSSFFYGYFLTQLPGGWLSMKIGGVRLFSLAICLGSITTMLIPIAARKSLTLLLIARFLTGVFHGPVLPSLGSIWGHWAPVSERSRLIGIAMSGLQIGNIISMPVIGYMCVSEVLSWTSVFYLFGLIGLVWSASFFFCMSDSPLTQRFISSREKIYIAKSNNTALKTPKKIPWLAILTSRTVLATNLCSFSFNWGLYLYLTQIPSYIKDVLKFDIKSNGVYSALPYLFCSIQMIGSGFIGDYLISKQIYSRLAVRKIFTCIALMTPALALVALSFVTCSTPYLGVFLLTFGFSFKGLASSVGFNVTLYEIGGPYNSIIVGLANMVGAVSGFLGPLIVGVLTANHKQEEWRVVLWLTAALYFIGSVAFLLYGDVNVQSWAICDENEEQSTVTNEIDLKSRFLLNKLTNDDEA